MLLFCKEKYYTICQHNRTIYSSLSSQTKAKKKIEKVKDMSSSDCDFQLLNMQV